MILPAEFVGWAKHSADGTLRIGDAETFVDIHLSRGDRPGWWSDRLVGVYVRRDSEDLSVVEVAIARHDGLGEEQLQTQIMEDKLVRDSGTIPQDADHWGSGGCDDSHGSGPVTP